MWNLDSIQSLLCAGLKIGGGYLLAKGLADESAVEAISAGVLASGAVLWGIRHRHPEKPRQAGEHQHQGSEGSKEKNQDGYVEPSLPS